MSTGIAKEACWSLNDKVALVTGAGVRLGRAIARELAAKGCDLVLHAFKSTRDAEELAAEIQGAGRRAVVLCADLSRGAQTLKLAGRAERAFGRVDILVNSAGIFWPTPLKRLNEKELNAFLDINLKSPYILSSEIGQRMRKRGAGAIVNVACVSALRPWKTHLPYSISKAALVAMTVGMAKLLGPQVRVNAVAPGTVLPPEDMSSAKVEELRQRLPLKKIGTPEDVAAAIVYLLEAPFVTGQVLCVDGGRVIV